jgi:UDP-N-acetylmuramoyl-tripeptide--D-alanyl-D-alanine ligase
MADERPSMQQCGYTEMLAEGIEHHLEGEFNRYNVAAATAIGNYFNINPLQIAAAIASYHPDNNRSQRTETAHNTLVVDCYNANPSSMQASIGHFLNEPLGDRSRRVLILGDMRELGAWSAEEHRLVIGQATASDAEVWLVGGAFREAFESIETPPENARLFASCEALCAELRQTPLRDALILIKGSHSIGLERTIPHL